MTIAFCLRRRRRHPTINLFNEKIFIFLWFWYVFLALVGAVNMMKWLFRALYWPGQVQYVRKQPVSYTHLTLPTILRV